MLSTTRSIFLIFLLGVTCSTLFLSTLADFTVKTVHTKPDCSDYATYYEVSRIGAEAVSIMQNCTRESNGLYSLKVVLPSQPTISVSYARKQEFYAGNCEDESTIQTTVYHLSGKCELKEGFNAGSQRITCMESGGVSWVHYADDRCQSETMRFQLEQKCKLAAPGRAELWNCFLKSGALSAAVASKGILFVSLLSSFIVLVI